MRTQHRMGFPDLHVPRPQLFSESESQSPPDFEARGEDSAALQAAKKLLAEGPSKVTREISVDRIEWDTPKDRALMDHMRIQVLDALEALGPQ